MDYIECAKYKVLPPPPHSQAAKIDNCDCRAFPRVAHSAVSLFSLIFDFLVRALAFGLSPFCGTQIFSLSDVCKEAETDENCRAQTGKTQFNFFDAFQCSLRSLPNFCANLFSAQKFAIARDFYLTTTDRIPPEVSDAFPAVDKLSFEPSDAFSAIDKAPSEPSDVPTATDKTLSESSDGFSVIDKTLAEISDSFTAIDEVLSEVSDAFPAIESRMFGVQDTLAGFSVCAWAETSVPIVAVVPFEAAGVAQDDADAFAARFTETLATSGTVSVADTRDVGALLARQGLAAFDLIDAERAASFATEAGADFLVVGKVFALGDMAGAFVTILGVKPPTAFVAVRQAESLDALMAEVTGLCAELLGNMAK